MNIKNKHIILSIVFIIVFVIVIIFFKRINYQQAQFEKINFIGDSQIGLGFSNDGNCFMYASFEYIKDSTIFNVILNKRQKNKVYENRYFGGFVNDTIIIMFDLNDTCFLYKLSSDKLYILQKSYTNIEHESEFGTFKPDIYKNKFGFFYIKDTRFSFYSLQDNKDSIILSCESFGENYSNLTSFDINKENGIFCLKKQEFNSSYFYDLYTYNFSNNSISLVYKTPRTKHLTYEPIVKYINDSSVLTSFRIDNNKSLLFKIDLIKRKAIETYSLDNLKVINITSNKINKHYLTLLNDEIRDSLSVNNINIDKGIYGGVNVYSFIP